MNRFIIAAIIVIALSAGITFGMEKRDRTLKLISADASSPLIAEGARLLAEDIRRNSDGRLLIDVVDNVGDGVPARALAALQEGKADVMVVATRQLIPLAKEFILFELPFQFQSEAEIDAVFDGRIGQQLFERLKDAKLTGVGYWDGGFVNLANQRKPIALAADLRDLKFGIEPSPLSRDLMRAWGAVPASIRQADLLEALRRDAIDGLAQDLTSIRAAYGPSAPKYLTLTRHAYEAIAVIVNSNTWESLSTNARAAVTNAVHATAIQQRKRARSERIADLEKMRSAGAAVSELPAVELAKLRELSAPVTDKYMIMAGREFIREARDEIRVIRSHKR